ncbi:MAG: BMP family ABC transporter substrate-binding protein [Actinomycetaceae bacterium]|nr:BMP family ABC transporter substrate-binding protein [Actinomycetaceae bacterium]
MRKPLIAFGAIAALLLSACTLPSTPPSGAQARENAKVCAVDETPGWADVAQSQVTALNAVLNPGGQSGSGSQSGAGSRAGQPQQSGGQPGSAQSGVNAQSGANPQSGGGQSGASAQSAAGASQQSGALAQSGAAQSGAAQSGAQSGDLILFDKEKTTASAPAWDAIRFMGVDPLAGAVATTAQSLGVEWAFADGPEGVAELVEAKCTLIIGRGPGVATAMAQARDTGAAMDMALLGTSAVDKEGTAIAPEKIRILDPRTRETAFLAGLTAAGLTSTGTVGVIGAGNDSLVKAEMDAFAQGVEHYNATYGSAITVNGWDRVAEKGSILDAPASAGQVATALAPGVQSGMDIVMPITGSGDEGALTALAASKAPRHHIVWASESVPPNTDAILLQLEDDIPALVSGTINDSVNGAFSGGVKSISLADGGVRLLPGVRVETLMSPELKALVAKTRADITSGTLPITTKWDPKGE